jgi:hypothetical protein
MYEALRKADLLVKAEDRPAQPGFSLLLCLLLAAVAALPVMSPAKLVVKARGQP